MRVLLTALALSVTIPCGLASCNSPCRHLAAAACADQGEGSKACLDISMMAEKASEEEQGFCGRVLRILGHSNSGNAR